jgi:hypothetical protein
MMKERQLVVPSVVESSSSSKSRNLVMGNKNVRLAVFGSSNSWGAMLTSRFDAYPYLLSPEVVNYADYSAGPNYPSVCLNTIMRSDEVFDAIILDYWLKAPEGLLELALRLRKRFPRAIIVFLKTWTPDNVRRAAVHGSSDEMNIYEWKVATGIQDAVSFETIKNAIAADTGYWYFPNFENADAVYKAAVEAVGGIHFEFPKRDTVQQTLIDYIGYFDITYHLHVSSLGNSAIAKNLHNIIQIQHDRAVKLHLVSADNQGSTWGEEDSCHLWYTTGGCRFDYSPNWKMTEFDPRQGKYALYVEQEGWIDVKNEMPDSRTLYLSFLATNETVYPKTLCEFKGTDGLVSTTELNPAMDQDKRHPTKHMTRTIAVGKIPHGTTRITLKPQSNTTLPFRLVGASFTNEVAVPMEFGFGPGFNA